MRELKLVFSPDFAFQLEKNMFTVNNKVDERCTKNEVFH